MDEKLALESADSPFEAGRLEILRKQYEKEGEHVTEQTKFNFAWALVRSNNRADQQEGVLILSDLVKYNADRRRECLYYLAVGHRKLGNYQDARHYNDRLLEKEPGNGQAVALKGLIDYDVQREGILGMTIVGGIAAAALVAGTWLFKATTKKR